ncbi:MAG: MCE family protein [Gemmatimonadales bacterium]|nr:MAG: MCE family protein [Gemmatimonadales bacterium]
MTPVVKGRELDDREIRANLPTDTGSRHLRLGLFMILGFVSFFVVLFLLTDPGTFRGRYDVFTTLDDAGGVRRGDPIQMRGVIIGRVSGFEMARDGSVNIRLEIEGEWGVPEGSTVQLAEAGLFGGRTVAVLPGEGPDELQPGDTIPGQDRGGGVMAQAGDLAEQAGEVLERLGTLLDTTTISSVQGTTQEVLGVAREFRAVIAEQGEEIARLTASLNRAATGLEDVAGAAPDVASAAAHADSLLADLNLTADRLDAVVEGLDAVIGRMARGEGTLGRLSQDESLYQNMDQAVLSLNELLVDLRENPGRYLTVEIF